MQKFPDHIKWLLENFSDPLQKRLKQEKLNISTAQALEVLMRVDPSEQGGAVDWLVKTYIRNGFRWEDVEAEENSKANRTLQLFGKHRKQLEGNKRNLSEYQTLAQVYTAISAFAQEITTDIKASNKSLKRLERIRALEESINIIRTDTMIVSVPLTKYSAVWWGRGTQWCTASTESDNYFESYNDDAPLIVITFPQGLQVEKTIEQQRHYMTNEGVLKFDEITTKSSEKGAVKFQLWVSEDDFQFMNEADEEVDADTIENNWGVLKPFFQWAANINPETYQKFPAKYLTRNLVMEIIDDLNQKKISSTEILDEALSGMDDEWFTPKMCWYLATNYSEAFDIIPTEKLTRKLVKQAIISGSTAYINYKVPDTLMNKEIYGLALDRDIINLTDIPDKLLTKEMCFRSIEISPRYINNIPKRFQTKEFFEKLATIRGCEFKDFPKQFIDYDLCLKMVASNGLMLKHIPKEFWCEELLLAAVKQDGDALEYISLKWHDKNLLLAAVTSRGDAIRHIHKTQWEQDIVKAAVTSQASVLEYVDLTLLNEDIILKAVSMCGEIIETVPVSFWSESLLLAAVQNNGCSLRSIVERLPKISNLSEEFLNTLYKKAIMQNSYAISFIDKRVVTEELFLLAIGKKSAISINSFILNQCVPSKMITPEFLDKAYMVNNSIIDCLDIKQMAMLTVKPEHRWKKESLDVLSKMLKENTAKQSVTIKRDDQDIEHTLSI